MVDIKDKRQCTGCGACVVECPKSIIHMSEDDEGVKYPFVDVKKCIHCGKCDLVCPMKDGEHGVPIENTEKSINFYAAQLVNKEELGEVSSGGAFWALAQTVIDENGIVYGAKQRGIDEIRHERADNIELIKKFRKSKYLQSNTEGIYVEVKKDLTEGKTVLFSGTACQIAGLNKYLHTRHDNLITCEVVCHGVPCGLAWKSYRSEKEKRVHKKIRKVVFRDKSKGWNDNHYKIIYEDGSVELERSDVQLFHTGYLRGLFYRPSCGTCPFATIPRVADITMADFWEYSGKLNKNGNIGISLLLSNNIKGEAAIRKSLKYMEIEEVEKKEALYSCRHLSNAPHESECREAFMDLLKKRGYHKAISKYIESSNLIIRLKNKIKRCLKDE